MHQMRPIDDVCGTRGSHSRRSNVTQAFTPFHQNHHFQVVTAFEIRQHNSIYKENVPLISRDCKNWEQASNWLQTESKMIIVIVGRRGTRWGRGLERQLLITNQRFLIWFWPWLSMWNLLFTEVWLRITLPVVIDYQFQDNQLVDCR